MSLTVQGALEHVLGVALAWQPRTLIAGRWLMVDDRLGNTDQIWERVGGYGALGSRVCEGAEC